MLIFFVLGAFVALTLAQKEYAVPIMERGVLVNQKVKFVGRDLEIFEVPKHHELSHVTVLLDYSQRLQMMVYHEEQECRLSELSARYESPRMQKRHMRQHAQLGNTIDARNAHSKTRLNYRNPVPLDDVSFLRSELQEACFGLPVYKMKVIEVDGVMNNGTFYNPYSYDESEATSQTLSGRHKRQTEFMCMQEEFMQKCYVKKASQGCFYIIHCESIGVGDPDENCIEHIRDTEVRCVPCCDNRAVPDDSFIKDCLKVDFSEEETCNRTMETVCYPMPAPQQCARTVVKSCDVDGETTPQQLVTLERCGNWECDNSKRRRK